MSSCDALLVSGCQLAEAGVPVRHDLLSRSRHAVYDRPGSSDGVHAIARLRDWLTCGASRDEEGRTS